MKSDVVVVGVEVGGRKKERGGRSQAACCSKPGRKEQELADGTYLEEGKSRVGKQSCSEDSAIW